MSYRNVICKFYCHTLLVIH